MTRRSLENRVETLEAERGYGELDNGMLYLRMLEDSSEYGRDWPGAAAAYMRRLEAAKKRERRLFGTESGSESENDRETK